MQFEISSIFTIVGEIVIYTIIFLLIAGIFGSMLIAYSFKTEKFIFPYFTLFL